MQGSVLEGPIFWNPWKEKRITNVIRFSFQRGGLKCVSSSGNCKKKVSEIRFLSSEHILLGF